MGINIAKALEKISIPIYIDTGLTRIMQLSQNSDQCDLKLSGLTQNLTQSGESGASKSGGKRLPFFIEGFVSPENILQSACGKYSIQCTGLWQNIFQ